MWRIIYKFLNVCSFDYTAFAVSGKVGPVNRLTTPIDLLVIQLTVLSRYRNCCVIEYFCDVVYVILLVVVAAVVDLPYVGVRTPLFPFQYLVTCSVVTIMDA